MKKVGFTLIEVIISSLLLSITVGGILYLFSTEKVVVSRTGRKVQAADFARQTLEQLKNAVRADTWPGGNLAATVGIGVTVPLSPGEPCKLRDIFFGTRHYTVTDEQPGGGPEVDYKSVTVTVDWTEP